MREIDEGKSGKKDFWILSLTALGVVFGDIGTSPIYALRESFHLSHGLLPTRENTLGVLSLIFWSLILVISVKYLLLVLRADNRGEGGIIALTAFISRYRADRDINRAMQDQGDFVEVFVDCPIGVCERRDPRGLYAKARAGRIPEFTGVSAPYEPPVEPELILHTDRETEEESAARVVEYLDQRGYLRAP